MKISGHRLLTANLDRAIDFYRDTLGMKLVGQQQICGREYAFLSFNTDQDVDLILVRSQTAAYSWH